MREGGDILRGEEIWYDRRKAGEEAKPLQHCAQFFLGIWRAIVECAQQQTGLFLGLIVLSPVIFFLVRNLLQNCVQGAKNLLCPVEMCIRDRLRMKRERARCL